MSPQNIGGNMVGSKRLVFVSPHCNTFLLPKPLTISLFENPESPAVRGKNERVVTKFYISNFYLRYENYIWGESNLYRCALTPNIMGLKGKVSSRYGPMIEISRVSISGHFGGTGNFAIFKIGKSRFSPPLPPGLKCRQGQTILR